MGKAEMVLVDCDERVVHNLDWEELVTRAEKAEAALASATDLANVYARENGLEQANHERGLNGVIDRLAWRCAEHRGQRDNLQAEVELLRVALIEYVGSASCDTIEGYDGSPEMCDETCDDDRCMRCSGVRALRYRSSK